MSPSSTTTPTSTKPSRRRLESIGPAAREFSARLRALIHVRYNGVMRQAARAWDIKPNSLWRYTDALRPRVYFPLDSLVKIERVESCGFEWLLGLTRDTKDGRKVPPYSQ